MKLLLYNTNMIGPTFTGKTIDLTSLNIAEIDIDDIAHALSMICRFGGHTKRFYSVAEHSYLVSKQMQFHGYSSNVQFAALMHDASEYLLNDMMRPLRRQTWMRQYNDFHTYLQGIIEERFGVQINKKDRIAISEYDRSILLDEKAMLLPNTVEWDLGCHRLGILIHCWSPQRAEQEFLRLFYALSDSRQKAAVC